MKTVAFIPIKLNNERTPGKNTKRFSDGTPLVYFVQKTLLQLDGIDEIYVFCSNDEIKSYLLDGVNYLKRSNTLDTKETLSGDLIRAFVNTVEADIYIMANATSPFISLETYRKCIDAVQKEGYMSSFASKRMQNFIWYNSKPLNFSLNYAPRTQDMTPVFCELSSPYVFKKEVFEIYGGRTSENPYICECTDIEAVDIDYPDDFLLADLIYTNLLNGKGQF